MALASSRLRPRIWGDVFAVGLAVAFAAACFATGQFLIALAAVGMLVFAAAVYARPLIGIAVLIFLSTDGLKFFSLEKLPYLQLGPGMRLNAADLVLALLLVVGVAKMRRRHVRPHFGAPLLVLGTVVAISLGVGLVSGTVDVGVGFNGLRVFSGYLLYVALVGTVDTPAKLRALIHLVFVVVAVSVVIQVVEASLGERLTTPMSSTSTYFSETQFVANIDGTAPYLWNRAVGYLLIGFFFALGGWLWSKRNVYGAVAIVAAVGFIIALVRQWYVFIAVGIVLLLMLGSRKRSGAMVRIALGTLLLVALVSSASWWLPSGFEISDALQQRTASILNFQSDSTFQARVATFHAQLDVFRSSPIVGLGPGTAESLFSSGATGWSTDIGMTNTLVQYGVLGIGAIVLVIASVLRTSLRLIRTMPASSGREYAAAAFSVWVAMVVAYGFTQDFFTSTELGFAVGFVMAVVDRLNAFATGTEPGTT